MSTVLESITKKIEQLKVGKIYEDIFEPENVVAVLDIEDPHIYKGIFNLDNKGGLGIEKTLKSFLLEVRDSELCFYYVLDDSCLSIDFLCKYQMSQVIREIPLEAIAFLRVLCAKKAPLELNITEDFLYIIFEDSIPKDTTPKLKLKKGEKREKVVASRYTLEIPLYPINNYNADVVRLFKQFIEAEKEPYLGEDKPLSIDISNISYEKQPLEVYKYEVEVDIYDKKEKLLYITTNELFLNLIFFPLEVGKSYEKEEKDTILLLSTDFNCEEDINEIDSFLLSDK